MILEANPGYRGFTWNFEPGDDPADKAIAARMRGKRMPRVGTIDISVMEEAQSSWLAFQRGELDLLDLPSTFAPVALPGGKLAPDLAKRGVYLSRILLPSINYTAFNMRDPVVGGFGNEKLALRRAIAMAYDTEAEVRIIRKGQAAPLQMIIPPGVAGIRRALSKRTAPRCRRRQSTARPLRLQERQRRLPAIAGRQAARNHLRKPTMATSRELDEMWKKALDSLGIRMNVEKGKSAIRSARQIACKHQLWSYGWIADYPDGDNFMQLLYGGNIGQSNVACYKSPTFDALYEKSRLLPDSPDRDTLFEQMTRQFETECPWRLGVAGYQNTLAQPNVIGYKAHPGAAHRLDLRRRRAEAP